MNEEHEKEDKVVVYLLMKDQNGRVFGIGNSHECTRAEATAMIERGEAKAETHPQGVVPPEWQQSKDESQDDVAAEAEEEDGGYNDERRSRRS